jgi:Coenzyme PQQ synthesis protein D (PqqD)
MSDLRPPATHPLPAPNPQVLFTEIDDGSGVLLHLDTKFYYTLNPTAVVVWKALRDGADAGALAARLVADFRVELDVARRDVAAVLDDLLADGLLVASP